MADGLERMQQAGFFLRNVKGLTLQNVEISGQVGPAFRLADIEGGTINACYCSTPDPDAPVMDLENVTHALVNACRAAPGTGVFLRLTGTRTGRITLKGNELSPARQPVFQTDDVPSGSVEGDPHGAG
jgi:hypothetical protein